MSPNQHKFFYLKEWTPCARANNWHSLTALYGQPAREGSHPLDQELLAQVRACAKQLAQREHRGERPNDFRHACHLVALTREKSSLDLTNDECTRVVDLFRVLREPDNLKFIAHWEDPLLSKKENLIIQAKAKAPMQYIAAIIADKFHTRVLEDLSIGQLQKLCFTLNQRQAKWSAPARSYQPQREQKLEYAKGPF